MAKRAPRRRKRVSAERGTAAVPPPAPPSRGRLWAFRLVTLAIAPLAFVLLEGGLRLAGVGYPTAFLVEDELAGQRIVRDNPHFARRFFPPPLYRSPRPFTLARTKAPNAYRVLVLGESAALGDPAPAFGFARILGVMLQERYPERRIEVVNTAVTAINSHAIREIAAEGSRLQPDLFLIYMGNNEVVGPYGAGTVFHPARQGLAAIRAQLFLKRLRLGQVADQWARRLRRAPGPERWEGMAMFLGHQVRSSDPGLATVRRHFRRNLEDVMAAAERAGAKVLLSTIATNLGDQAPFASAHRSGLGEAQEKAWDLRFSEGQKLESEGRWAEALGAYAQAAALDDEHAELAYRQARCLYAQAEYEDAHRGFVRARDLDTLRFRADTAVNDIIREVAGAHRARGVTLLDVEAAFRRESPHGIAGEELLYEHVHMTFEGNYRIAREALDAIVPLLPPARAAAALPAEECARRLAFTPWHRHKLLREVIDRVRRPPFAGQLGSTERRARLEAQARALRPLLGPSGLDAAIAGASPAAAADPGWERHEGFAELLDAAGRTEQAVSEWKRVLAAVPHNHEAHGRLGVLLLRSAQPEQALGHFEHARRLRPDVADPYNNLGAFYGGQARWVDAEHAYRRALAVDPLSPEALINLAAALATQGHTAEGETLYRRAAARPAYSAETRYQLALLADALGLSAEVEPLARGALEIEPDHLGACELLAAGFRKSGQVAQAIAYFDALARQAQSAPAHQTLAELLEEQDRLGEAEDHYRQALALDPTLPGLHAALAWLLATSPDPRLRNGPEAVALGEEACRGPARDPEALNALAAAYAEARRFDDARRTAREAVAAARAAGQEELAANVERLADIYAQGRAYPLPGAR